MSTLLRLSRTLRPPLRPLRNPHATKAMPSHFFSPSPLGLPRSRFYTRTAYPNNYSSNLAVLYTLMGTNIAIFSYAMYLKAQAVQGYQQPFVRFIKKMTLNLNDVQNGRYLPIITSVFTHLDFWHLFSNMLSVYFLGRFLAAAPVITPVRYLAIALGSGIAGSIGHLFSRRVQREARGGGSEFERGTGFSGSIMGISTVAACLAPSTRVYIWGVVPMPLWTLVSVYGVYDGYYLNDTNSRVGHAGHLGGLVFGLVYYVARLRGLRF
ncbi:hypothetical protein BDW02DRAFT_644934 [Decorospora gaudefroyi]|uniref:Peptidase S54 rhomboid domain-containing protein n=1 Tax=Decorospora gaudefroyi TaxID=184978 RepID=A0A6A5KQP9_9PLEO|nr:hypothetical protein BDW02DRAFT_644934 [Decorospora gaudefroyi]